MLLEVVCVFGILKKVAVLINVELGVLEDSKRDLIVRVFDQIILGELEDHFLLVVW